MVKKKRGTEKTTEWMSLCEAETDQYLLTRPCFRQHSFQIEQTVSSAQVMSSCRTEDSQRQKCTGPPSLSSHTETLGHETKAQVKLDKRCLWIFWVTPSNQCLHSPCNYLLTDLILAGKWLAKSMCTQTRPESKVVHVVYLPAPSHSWYTAMSSVWQEAPQSDLTRVKPQDVMCAPTCVLTNERTKLLRVTWVNKELWNNLRQFEYRDLERSFELGTFILNKHFNPQLYTCHTCLN